MRVIVDCDIPYIKGVLEPYFDVYYLKGTEFTPDIVASADALIIRTRTKCTEELLRGSSLSFIGSATIGFDHIDIDYCKQNGVEVATAAGCNALAVVQYVLCAIEHFTARNSSKISTIGVVGVGNVGSALTHELKNRGYRVLTNDPPRAAKEHDFINSSLDELLTNCDLITFHTPLDNSTRGMVNSNFFNMIEKPIFLINSSRGEVIDECALIKAIDSGKVIAAALDVWLNEPRISTHLLNRAAIATPHIAGYSAEGKANGSAMMVRAIAKKFNIPELLQWYPKEVTANSSKLVTVSNYDIMADDKALRIDYLNFEQLRNHYNYRKE